MKSLRQIWLRARLSAASLMKDRRGIAATEFAFIVPIMLVMFFGTMEFSPRQLSDVVTAGERSERTLHRSNQIAPLKSKGRADSTAFFSRYVWNFESLGFCKPDRTRFALAGGAQIVGRRLARAAIGNDFVADLLAFTQCSKSGALYGADVHEHVVATIIRLNEAEALGRVKPLHGSHAHGGSPFSR
jgi:hypothetical protein